MAITCAARLMAPKEPWQVGLPAQQGSGGAMRAAAKIAAFERASTVQSHFGNSRQTISKRAV
jgi:hypothetical protein